MSNWTHVAAIARVDSFRALGGDAEFDVIFGKECLWGDPMETWVDAEDNPDNYLPMGSEGTLRKTVWKNPNKHHLDAYTVSIFGDLRDHDNAQEIVDWFKEKLEALWIRNAVITVENEQTGTITWTYNEEEIKNERS